MQPDVSRALPELRTDRLVLRGLRNTDAVDIFAYARDPEVARHTLWHPHRDLQDTYAFLDFIIEQNHKSQAFVWGIVRRALPGVIGTIGLANYNPGHTRAELGFALARHCWNQGYTTEAARCVLSFAFRELGLNRVEAFCKPANGASSRVLEKCGFQLEGLLRSREYIKGSYEDLRLYAILRMDYFQHTTQQQA